jgi:hypothetical protein
MSFTPTEPINLIYIASIGRSGTTLLESILGAHPDIQTCGEVHIWPHEILMGGVRPCGSGEYVQNDPFWQEMRNRVDPFSQPRPWIHYFREFHNHGYTLRLKRLGDFLSGPLEPAVQAQVDQYSANNVAMFQAFSDLTAEVTGTTPEWIVDASKDPYRLLWLIRSGFFNLKVIHMVKNPPAFIYSVTKAWLSSDDPLRDWKRLYYSSRQSVAWTVQNALFSAIARTHLSTDEYRLVRYEDLASRAYGTVECICDFLDIPYVQSAVDNFRAGSPFTIAGNPMRYRRGGIKLDEKWKSHLPASSRRIASFVTTPIRHHYGY